MELSRAKALCTERGCELLRYEEGRKALIQLPSCEQVLVSMGASSVKVFRKGGLLGWFSPKTVLSFNLRPIGWDECTPLARSLMAFLLVDGTINLITEGGSIQEIAERFAGNFSELLTEEMNKQMAQ
jgi:hypothetical protein